MLTKTLYFFEKHNKTSLGITLFIAIFIFYMSSITFSSGSGIYKINILSIIYHFSVFFALNLFLIISLNKNIDTKYFFILITISLVYASLDELHQAFVPGRFPSVNDFYINSTGILLSSLSYISMKKLRKNNMIQGKLIL